MKKLCFIIIAGILLCSCKKDFLNVKNVDADVPVESLYTNYNYVQQVVWNAYSYLPDGFDKLDMEAATDNAESTNVTARSQDFNYGIWNQYNNPDGVWASNFDGIRQANLYLKNKGKVDISYIRDKITSTDSTTYFSARDNVKFMEGEALFLKAFFYFELIKRYGGVPIFEEPLDYSDPATWKNVQRASLNDCIRYIVTLCDKAATIIPANLSTYTWYEAGRVTLGAIKALKSRTLLYGASPLYKEKGSTVTWVEAAQAARDVIALNVYSLDASYANLFGASNTTSKEAIFYRRYGSQNGLEYNNFPIAFEGSNGNSITPSQNLVDDFEVLVKNGSGTVTGSVPFDWNNPTHAANPYLNRDPRLAATVIYNGATFKSTVIQTYTGGNSGLPKQNATKTGYYLLKWVNPSVDLINNTKTVHSWLYFRYAETLLNYAEAMFNAYGADGDPLGYGLTALGAINMVRNRTGIKMPLLTSAQLNQSAIEHERNVELSFEGHRFWDVRRWKRGTALFSVPLKRIEITNNNGTYTYAVKKLEDRVYDEKMNWYPIPQNEIAKTAWAQNAGW
jgi:hypothetical protein